MNKIIYVRHQERSGNRVFQYLAAGAIANRVAGAEVRGYDLDIFNVRDPRLEEPLHGRILDVEAGHDLNVGRLAHYLNSDLFDAISLKCWGMRLEYMPTPAVARDLLFRQRRPGGGAPIGPDEILLHVRAGGEFTSNPHPDYPLLPVSYYAAAISLSGKKPVFIGQVDYERYRDKLMSAFPGARFIQPADPLSDFKTIMSAPQIVCSVSSFCWLAAWMALDAKQIIMPVYGLFDPRQRPDVDLIPHNDPRFSFLALDREEWRGSAQQMKALEDDRSVWRLSPSQARELKAEIAFRTESVAGRWSATRPTRHRNLLINRLKRALIRLGGLTRSRKAVPAG